MSALRRSFATSASLGAIAALLAIVLPSLAGASAPSTVATPYSVTFSETGLPSGTNWSVHVTFLGCGCGGVTRTVQSNLPTLSIPVTNGTYRFTVLRVPGYFVNGSARGVFNVSGANVVGPSFTFEPVISFVTQFTESGLPAGTPWTVNLTGNGTGQLRFMEDQTETTTGTTMAFMLPNGTYWYSVSNVPGSFFLNHSSRGKFVVAGGSPTPLSVRFTTPATFAVTFLESGLLLGTNWSVRVNGAMGVPVHETHASSSNQTVFALPNGSYHYVLAEVLGFNVLGPVVGSFVVNHAPLTIAVAYQAVPRGGYYAVAFQENGLAPGTHWWVSVIATHTFGHSRSAAQSSSGTTLFFLLQNGTYRFQVHSVRGYTLTGGGTGTFVISGAAPSVLLVNFTAIPTYSVTFTESGLPSGTNWTVLVRTEATGWSVWPVRQVERANTTSITFYLPNGTYCYTIYGVHGYVLSSGAAAGPVVVSGAPPSVVTVGFSARA